MTRPCPSADVARPAFARDRTTVVLYAALGVFGALQVVPGLVTPALRDELGYGYTLASLHVSAFAAAGVLAGLLAPRLDRSVGRRTVLLLGLAGMAVGVVALALGRGPVSTLAATVTGLLGTLIIVAVQSALSDHHGERRAVAFTESNVVASLGSTTAPLVVGAAAVAVGSWRWGVLALGLTGVVVALAARRTPVPATPPRDDDAGTSGRRLPAAARAGVGLVFTGVVLEWSVSYWGATYLREVVGLGRPAAVTAMTVFFAAMLTGRVAAGVLVRRVDAARLVATGLGVLAAGLAVHAASTRPAPALLGLALLGLGVSVLFPLGLSLAVAAAPLRPADVSGRCVVAGSSAVLLGPLVVGQLADAVGLRAALAVLPLVAVAAAVLLGSLVRQRAVPVSAGRRRSRS